MAAPQPNPTRLLLVSSLGFCLLASGCHDQARNNTEVDRLFAQWDRADSPGAAVVIVKDGAVVYEHGYGCADLEHHIPITPQTAFDVASVAKQFTGLSVAMLVQQGKLSLDDDVRQYLPDVPDFGKPITIGNLLHHTSGLRDWPETLSISGLDMQGPITLETILEMVRRQRELDFAPGEEEQYSNTGYNLLAAVIAKITGQSFRAWMDSNLFQPLGMKHTLVCDNPAEVVNNRALSYAPGGKGGFHQIYSQLAAQGSSSLFITAEDMGKWLLNFETARAGGKAALTMMEQPGKLNSGAKVDYGFGLVIGDYHGSPMFEHGGSWAGYRSAVLVIPEKRFAVAILSNVSNGPRMAIKIADLYLGAPPDKSTGSASSPDKQAAAWNPDPAAWDAFLGTYRLGPGWLLTITREGDQLMAQATHEDKFQMTPESGARFFVKAYGAPVEFVREGSGKISHLLYRGIHAPKLNLPTTTPAALAAYAGDYWSEELRTVVRLEVHDGRLAYHDRSGDWIRCLPIGKDRFDSEYGGIALEFIRDPSAVVTELKLSASRVRRLQFARVALPSDKPLRSPSDG